MNKSPAILEKRLYTAMATVTSGREGRANPTKACSTWLSRRPWRSAETALDRTSSNRSRQAEALVKQAHDVCPYSNATRGNIEVEVRLAGS